MPKRLRGIVADRPAAVAALTRIFLDEIERLLCAAAGVTRAANTPTAARPRLGAVSFLDRLADLVPPPRKHRHRYHGVFAPNHKLRKAVTALAVGNVGKRRDAALSPLSLWERAGARVPRTTQSPARMTPRGLPGRNSWPGWVRSFRSSARTVAATSGSEETAGRSRLTSNRRFASGRRPGWLRPRAVRSSRTWANRSNRRQCRPPAARPPTGASSCRCVTTATSCNRRPTSCLRSTSTRCEAGVANRLMSGYGEGPRRV